MQHNNNKDLGKLGENIALEYLLQQQYIIHKQNWRFGKAEADIIAFDPIEKCLVFVEVKTRKNTIFGYPEDSVGQKKQTLLFELASEYMHQIDYEQEIRFDIISIIIRDGKNKEIIHYKDAFFSNW